MAPPGNSYRLELICNTAWFGFADKKQPPLLPTTAPRRYMTFRIVEMVIDQPEDDDTEK